jgi:hypothetical protein
MSVIDIEKAMGSMSIEELAMLRDKATELYHARWDEQIAEDLGSGRLDALLDELDAEYEQGKTTPL